MPLDRGSCNKRCDLNAECIWRIWIKLQYNKYKHIGENIYTRQKKKKQINDTQLSLVIAYIYTSSVSATINIRKILTSIFPWSDMSAVWRWIMTPVE